MVKPSRITSHQQKDFDKKVKKIARRMRSMKADRESRVKKLQELWKKEFNEDLTYRMTRSILQHVKGFKHTQTKRVKSKSKSKSKSDKRKTYKRRSGGQKGGGVGSEMSDAQSGLMKDLPEGRIVTGFTGGHHPDFPVKDLPKEISQGVDTTLPKELQGQGP